MRAPAARGWKLTLLAPTEPGRRNRRPVDAAFLLFGAIVIGLTALAAASAEEQDDEVARAFKTVLAWADSAWRAAFVGLLAIALAIALEALLHRRWTLVRDLAVAVVLVVGAAFVLDGIVQSNWLPVEPHLLSNWGTPSSGWRRPLRSWSRPLLSSPAGPASAPLQRLSDLARHALRPPSRADPACASRARGTASMRAA
jgi:hypothetical protein